MTYINFEDFLSEILAYRVINLSWGLSNATSIQKFLIFFSKFLVWRTGGEISKPVIFPFKPVQTNCNSNYT